MLGRVHEATWAACGGCDETPMSGYPRFTEWKKRYLCAACKEPLSIWDLMYSDGCCPECGHVSSGTICDSMSIIARYKINRPWWMFWSGTPRKEVEVK